MGFTFKQFHIDDLGCGMPVSTDGVILGAWAPLVNAKNILDIGAGSGLLSLMAAQRSRGKITAIEMNEDAVTACKQNVAMSPWASEIEVIQADILQYMFEVPSQFDHIICNPPYFETGPQSQHNGRAQARHTGTLGFAALLKAINQLLTEKGQASLILPSNGLPSFVTALNNEPQLVLCHQCDIVSVKGKQANRVLLLLDRPLTSACQASSQLVIRERNHHYSEQMIALTQDFYLHL